MKHWNPTRDKTLILAVNLQKKLLCTVIHSENLVKKSVLFLKGAGLLGVPVLASEYEPEKKGELDQRIRKYLDEEKIYPAQGLSALTEDVVEKLEDYERVVVLGEEAHGAVFQTVVDLLALGKEVIVLEDAVSSRSEQNLKNALELMRQLGVFVATTELMLYDFCREVDPHKRQDIRELILQQYRVL